MDDDTTVPFPRARMLGGADNPLQVPEWTGGQLASILILQALKVDALIQVLLSKGVITEDELAESFRVSSVERLPQIMRELPRFE